MFEPQPPSEPPFRVAALYRFAALPDPEALRAELAAFAALPDPEALRAELAAFACARRIRGTLILAAEGINGTVAGSPAAVDALIAVLRSRPALAGLDVKLSDTAAQPFRRLKVKVKPEIVSMGVPGLDPRGGAGAYVEPADWNRLVADPETLLIDTRNAFEVALGTFPGAVNPGTESFGDFPLWVEANRALLANRRIAMFCTGGIRCEKATALLRREGLAEVFHLRGGILRYLEEVSPTDSLWRGECFVFDERVALKTGLAPGESVLCRACRRPVAPHERGSPLYREGVSCARCADRPAADRARFAERQRQVEIARRRGGAPHLKS